MTSSWSKRALAVAGVLPVLVLAGPGAASASPSPTPNGWVGACNMVSAWPGLGHNNGVGVQAGGGMERAMSVNNTNGNDGMFNAVFRSGNQAC